ncbi:MAG: uridine diphosphate-N-acetylglucosamine-binding protein YvcK [Corynebacterium sp.]|nr:uridine diphosphate-N-acetylglucosamine-binding protein YvcK [Corynebacterium sp.]
MRIVSCGGGHGLFQTLRALERGGEAGSCDCEITAIVGVADDGGSSGRIRQELKQVPPGDLRMAIAALTPPPVKGGVDWEKGLQHRFSGHGALAGHAVGNLLIAGLTETEGGLVAALDAVVRMVGAHGRVLPVCTYPLIIEADVAGLDPADSRIVSPIRGQVAVASTTGSVRRVRLVPPNIPIAEEARAAIASADVITIGPGSWFTSVIPHVLVPGFVDEVNRSAARKILILNLTAQPGETTGFSAERYLHMLIQHAPQLRIDTVLIDAHAVVSERERIQIGATAAQLSATVEYRDVAEKNEYGVVTDRHDPRLLGIALRELAEVEE